MPGQPLLHRAGLAARVEAGEPGHHPGIAVTVDGTGQRLIDVGVVHHIAQVVQRHLQIPVGIAVAQRRRLVGVVQHQHPAGHRLDAADADAGQVAVGDPRNEAVGGNFLGSAAGQFPVLRGGVVDHQNGQMVAFLDGAQLAQQPGAIVFRDFLIAPGAGVPGAVQRFGGHHLHLAGQLGDQLEAPVENQLNARKTLVQGVDHAHQTLLLGLLVKVPGQAVGVERVQEEPSIALLPQGCDHGVSEKIRPLRGGLVDHVRLPVGIAGQLPLGRNLVVIRPRGVDFGHRRVGVDLGRRQPGRSRVVGIDDQNVKISEFAQGDAAAVIQCHGGRRLRPGVAGQQGAGQKKVARPLAQNVLQGGDVAVQKTNGHEDARKCAGDITLVFLYLILVNNSLQTFGVP